MGILTTLLSLLSKISLFLLLLAVVPGLPPYVEFEAFSVTPPVPLQGLLALNSRLNGAERLLEGQIHGPEDLKVHNGQLYTSLHGGHVVRIVNDRVESVVKFGQDCEGFHEEDKCGRPLGLAFDKNGKLYVADAYYGVFKVDPSTGKSVKLVSMNDTIDGKKPRIPNGVTVASDDSVYWTDSSTSHSLHDGLFTALANGNGRLLKYSPSTKSNTVLLDKINFPNGVALSADESFLVVSETLFHRLIKYHLRGPKVGQSEVFLDGLPGMPDNIHPDGQGGFVVSLVVTRDSDSSSPITSLGPYPLVRKLVARGMYLTQAVLKLLRDFYPVDLLKRSVHIVGHFESLPAPSVPRATVLFLTGEGKVSRSLYATDGLTGVSDCVRFGDYYYLGSPFNHFLARVKAD
uniref:Strictosidine synthase conserved region domain-containing protein n=2 Tax=Graphocephala atropunctata TaxID=36148 RepID=A0A1B6M1N5_9HEMI